MALTAEIWFACLMQTDAKPHAGAAAGLAVLFVPLAILPTIQFGTSEAAEDAHCGELLKQARASTGGKVLSPPADGASAGR
jgi:hypothetical protein